jgi:hypothetical protein
LATSFIQYDPNTHSQSANSGIIKVYEIKNINGSGAFYEYWGGSSHNQTGLVGTHSLNGASSGEHLGTAVRISDDGNTVVAGATRFFAPNTTSSGPSGRLRVFKKGANANSTWGDYGTIEPKFNHSRNGTASSVYAFSRFVHGDPTTFGTQISISSDGNIIAIGSSQPDKPLINIGLFRAYYYAGDGSAHEWRQLGQTIYGTNKNSHFGRCLSMNKNGTKVVVVSPFMDVPHASDNIDSVFGQPEVSTDGLAGVANLYCLSTGTNPLTTRRLTTFLDNFT